MKKNESLLKELRREYRELENQFTPDMRLEDYERGDMSKYVMVMTEIDVLISMLKELYKEV